MDAKIHILTEKAIDQRIYTEIICELCNFVNENYNSPLLHSYYL